MNIDVLYKPAMALAKVDLAPGESIKAEAGAMVGMSTNLNMETGMQGGFLKSLGRKMMGGESFFQNTFTPQNGPGQVLLAHSLPGDITTLEVPQNGLYVQSSSYIASSTQVEVNSKIGGFKTFFAGEGLFVLQVTAHAANQPLIIGAFGGIQEIVCNGSIVIDTGHLVAWDSALSYRTTKSAKGWIASFLSGEGLVCHFEGQGRIWIQSRNPGEYGKSIGPLLPYRN